LLYWDGQDAARVRKPINRIMLDGQGGKVVEEAAKVAAKNMVRNL